jgi:hypothetical protein
MLQAMYGGIVGPCSRMAESQKSRRAGLGLIRGGLLYGS